MLFSLQAFLSTGDDVAFEAFMSYIRKNPSYITTWDENGLTPLHYVVQSNTLSLDNKKKIIQGLLDQGIDLNQKTKRRQVPLRMAAHIKNNDELVKWLLSKTNDLRPAFQCWSDFKADAGMNALRFLGVWLAASVVVALCALLAPIIIFIVEAQFSALMIVVLCDTAFSLLIAIGFALDYIGRLYIKAPGHLSVAQDKVLQAINTVDGKFFNTTEGVLALFPSITFFRNSGLTELAKTEKGRAILMQCMPRIAANSVLLTNVFDNKSHRRLLFQHPKLLCALVNAMSPEQLLHYSKPLFEAFSANLSFFKKNDASSISALSKLTTLWSSETWLCQPKFSFIPKVFEQASALTSEIQLSKAYIALRGLCGVPASFSSAVAAFQAVNPDNPEAYITAQIELGYYELAQTNVDWLQHMVQAFSHFSNAFGTPVKVIPRERGVAREFLSESLLSDEAVDQWFEYGKSESLQDTRKDMSPFLFKTKEGDTPIVVAAKLGAWRMVEQIAAFQATDANDALQYGHALLLAVSANQTELAQRLIQQGALDAPRVWVPGSLNNACHEAIRMRNPVLLTALSPTSADLSHQNEAGDTPIVLAAKCGYWDLVKQMADADSTNATDDYHYATVLLLASKAKQEDVVESLVQQGAYNGKSVVDPVSNNSPCHEAIQAHHETLLTSLLRSSQDLSCINQQGLTPIVLAATLGYWDLVEQIATTYSSHSADAYQYARALFLAVSAKNIDLNLVNSLIRAGALKGTPWIDPGTGDSVWHRAVQKKNLVVLDFLEQHEQFKTYIYGVKNKKGETPFALAAQSDDYEVAAFFSFKQPCEAFNRYRFLTASPPKQQQADVASGVAPSLAVSF